MSKNKMIITRGVPASGKSTFAREWVSADPDNRIEVNRDNIREMMGFPGRGSKDQEKMVTDIHRAMIASAADSGKSVIVSDTNMVARFVKPIIRMGIDAGMDVEIKDFKIDFDTAVNRDRHRADSVGEDVIRNFFQRYPVKNWISGEKMIQDVKKIATKSGYAPYRNDPSNPDAILVDVDGTIAHNNGVRDFYDYTDNVMKDSPDASVIRAVKIAHDAGIKVIIMSGRGDTAKEATIRWMEKYNVPWDDIHMRADKDMRADWIIKDEMVREHIQDNYHVIWCYDDRNQVVDHHRAMGYQVFQVAPGDF